MMTRILFLGAALMTGLIGVTAALVIGSLGLWREWPQPGGLDEWIGMPLGLLLLLALLVGIWSRILRRRKVIQRLSAGQAYPYTPRGKYAVWSPGRRSAGRSAAFGARRTRKRMRRLFIPERLTPSVKSGIQPMSETRFQTSKS